MIPAEGYDFTNAEELQFSEKKTFRVLGIECAAGYSGNATAKICESYGYLARAFATQRQQEYLVHGCQENQCNPLKALPVGVRGMEQTVQAGSKSTELARTLACAEGLRLSAVKNPFCRITCAENYFPHYAVTDEVTLNNTFTCQLDGGTAMSALRCASG